MPIIVNSPYSGQPVKIRDQDIGRAVRDEENRVFYALPRSDGSGYYTAPTRQGGPKDEARYDGMAIKQAGAAKEMQRQAAALHDQTGKRKSKRGKLVLLVMLLIIIALAAYGWRMYGDEIKDKLPGKGDVPPPARIPVGATPYPIFFV